jgi:hypothetical protein
MLPGMEDTPWWPYWPWWLWGVSLLVGLAIAPKVIPVWLRYQLLRTLPPRWDLKNPLPARLRKTIPIPTRRAAVERRRISGIWLVLAIFNLITIPALTLLAGIVYHRIVIDWLRPPVYSILVKPTATWHHVGFVISPVYGFQMTIDAVVVFSFGFQNSDSYHARRQREQSDFEDRPRLVASYIEMPQGLDEYNLVFTNTGKEDATNIKIKVSTVGLAHAQRTLVTTPLVALLRVKPGMGYPVAMAPEKGLQFLVICVAYSNDRGTAFVDPPQFYVSPLYMKRTETRFEPALVTPLLYEELSAGFTCGDF